MTKGRHPFYWIVVFASAVYVFLFSFTAAAIARHFGLRKDFGWTVRVEGGRWVVSSVNPQGPAHGESSAATS